jgi:RHS repeat-associated protein
LTGVSLAGAVSASYTRNELGLVTAIADPNGNTWLYSYDAHGRRTSRTDPLGQAVTYQYDSRNRINQVVFPQGSLSITYDGTGNITRRLYSDGTELTYTFDAVGRLTQADGITLAYDANGHISASNGVTIGRDAEGRITSVTLASGRIVTYTYNSRDLLTGVSDWLGGTTSFSYDDAGQITSITRSNGVTTTYSYDNDGRLIGLQDGALASLALTRDGVGRITAATRTVPLAATLNDSTTTFTYDAACQVSSFTYDALGRLSSDASRTYSWDLADRLTGYTEGDETVSFSYDALGRMVSRTGGGASWAYVWNDALDLPAVNVVRQGGGDQRYYVFTPQGNLIYSIEASDVSRRFYHYDEMGNTLFLTDDSGTVIASYAYSPYGELSAPAGNVDNPFTWQGHYGVMQEGNSGLYYLRARYYDSRTGRFLARDSAQAIAPKSINPYQYSHANPLFHVDPLGTDEIHVKLWKNPARDRKTKERARAKSDNTRKKKPATVRKVKPGDKDEKKTKKTSQRRSGGIEAGSTPAKNTGFALPRRPDGRSVALQSLSRKHQLWKCQAKAVGRT